MKILIATILLLLTTIGSTFAKTKISILNGAKYEMEIVEATEEAAKARLATIVEKSSWMRCNWTAIEAGSILSRTGIDGLEYCHPTTFSIEITPVDEVTPAIEAAVAVKVKCGQDAIKFIAANNVLKGLNNEQIKTMAMTYSTIFDLLNAGAIDTALLDINAMTPDGTIVTYEDKTKIVNFLNNCNQ